MKRTKLKDRTLPRYSIGEEIANTVTHGIGILLALCCLVLCLQKVSGRNFLIHTGVFLYGFSMIAVYAVSTVYHGLRPGTAKKVLQVLDHCTIYALIAGTYSPILLSAFVPRDPGLGWGLFAFQWGCAVFSLILTAIDLRKYRVISMLAYILMGWCIIFFAPQALRYLGHSAMLYLLLGGVSYTVGAIVYGIGSKKPWFHSVFHIFVLLGSLLQFFAVYLYIL